MKKMNLSHWLWKKTVLALNPLIPFNYFQFVSKPLSKNILETVLPGRQGAWDTNKLYLK
jgi:hypothetical protein